MHVKVRGLTWGGSVLSSYLHVGLGIEFQLSGLFGKFSISSVISWPLEEVFFFLLKPLRTFPSTQ